MWFLLVEIILLMLGAFLLGAFLNWWWMRSRYEDVTETYANLLERSESDRGGVGADELDAVRRDLAKQITQVGARVESIPLPAPADLAPLQHKLDNVAEVLTAELRQIEPVAFDSAPLEARLERLEQRTVDLGPVHGQLRELGEQLAALRSEGQQDRQADLDTITSGVAALSATVAALRVPDLEPVQERLRDLDERLGASVDLAHARLEQIEARLKDRPTVELGPLHDRLGRLEAHLQELSVPVVDLTSLHARFDALEQRPVAGDVDLEPVNAHLRHLEQAVQSPGEALGAKLGELQGLIGALPGPEVDLGPVSERLDRLEVLLAERPAPIDLAPLEDRLTQIEEGLTTESGERALLVGVSDHLTRIEEHLGVLSAPSVDLAPVYERLTQLEALIATLREPMIDLSSVHERLERIDDRVANPVPVDLDGLHARLVGLEGAIQAMRPRPTDLSPVQTRLDTLEAGVRELAVAFAGLEIPEPDLSAVVEQFDTIEGRLDLASIESRLTAIEYGLAAVHHQLRSRGETVVTRSGGIRVERRGRPGTRFDPIDPMRRTPDGNLLSEAAFGTPDDLTMLDGVGEALRDLFHDLGVYYFWQIAEWSQAEAASVDERLLDFRGRVAQSDLVGQAKKLMARSTAAVRPRRGDAEG